MAGIRRISKYMTGLVAASWLAACGSSDTEDATPSAPAPRAESNMQRPTGVVAPAERVAAPLHEDTSDLNMPAQMLGVDLPILMSGAEPFWSGSIEGGWITLDRPGLPLIEVPIPELPDAVNGGLTFDAEGLNLSFSEGGCETGDAALGVLIVFEEAEYIGCAGTATPDVRTDVEVPAWYEMIPGSLTAIDSCLAEAAGPRFVRALYPREEGTVGMILVDTVGRYEECGAELETGALGFFDPVSADQAEIWFDGDVMFAREGQATECNILLEAPLDASVGQFHPAGCR